MHNAGNNTGNLAAKGYNSLSYKLIFEQSSDALFISDICTGKVVEVNKAGCELLGYTKEKLLNSNLSKLLGINLVSRASAASNRSILPGNASRTVEIKTKTGRAIPMDLTVTTLNDSTGNYFVTSLRDASSRVSYENKILSMNEELTQTACKKDKLFSIIAHDLKSPMNSLMTLSELLYEENTKITRSEIIESSRRINNLSKNTYELLENLLEWTLLQTKRTEIQKEELELKTLVDEVIKILQLSADLKKINLFNNIKKGSIVSADKNMLNTIIRNLISNAIKYSDENTGVHITSEEDTKSWKISVIDRGMGMEEEQIKNLFNLSPKTSCYWKDGIHRHGLGLSLCNEFIKLHGGALHINSRINEGSEFIVELPKNLS